MKSHLLRGGVSKNLWTCFKTTTLGQPTHVILCGRPALVFLSRAGQALLCFQSTFLSFTSCLVHGSLFTRLSFSLHQKPLQAWEHVFWIFCVLSLLINEILRPSQATTIHPSWDRVFKRPLLTRSFSCLSWFAHCIKHRHIFSTRW